MNKCKCGRNIYQRTNSTVKNKLCPTCTLKKAVQSGRSSTGRILYPLPGQTPTKGKKRLKTANNRSKYMKLADTWFSRLVRITHSKIVDGEVYSRDIITGKYFKASRLDNGHYFSRARMIVRYDRDNCRPQNRSSNRFRGEADKDKFQANLIKEIGQECFDELELRSKRTVFNYSGEDLKQLAEKFQEITNKLLKQKGAKKWW